MKRMKAIISRISLARESRIKYILPYENFLDRISAVATLVNFVEEKKADREIRHEARKYFVIACASAMEAYFKRTARIFIDAKWVKDDFLDILKQDKISLADLLEIDKGQLSLGEIISVSHSFQDLESINRVYSKMLGVTDFIEKVAEFEVETEEGKHIILKNDYPDSRRRINDLLKYRHLVIHHEGFKRILGLQRLGEMWQNLDAFVAAADDYILQKIPQEFIDTAIGGFKGAKPL